MDVFSLRDTVVREYGQFATSSTTIFADALRAQIKAIYAGKRGSSWFENGPDAPRERPSACPESQAWQVGAAHRLDRLWKFKITDVDASVRSPPPRQRDLRRGRAR